MTDFNPDTIDLDSPPAHEVGRDTGGLPEELGYGVQSGAPGECVRQAPQLAGLMAEPTVRRRPRLPPSVRRPMPVTIAIGPLATPFGTVELPGDYEAVMQVTQQRSSTGTSEPAVTITIRSNEWSYADAVVVP